MQRAKSVENWIRLSQQQEEEQLIMNKERELANSSENQYFNR